MLEAAKEALAFAHEKERDDIESNRILARALVECLRVVGEAARQVSIETRQQYPRVPWQDIIGMRNRLVHENFDINYHVVWQTVTVELPALVHALEEHQG